MTKKRMRRPRQAVSCHVGASADERDANFAKLITSAELGAYRVIGLAQPANLAEGIDAPSTLAVLRQQAAAVQSGDTAGIEAMLTNQAAALQALFVRLTERAMEQSHMPNFEAFMRMALRSQSQCRATLETLATIKNPPILYARQANVTTGPQQVNNGVPAPSRARGIENEHIQQLDARTPSAAVPSHSSLAAVGEVHRAEDAGG